MPKTFNDADEAEAWLRENPMREVKDKSGDRYRVNTEGALADTIAGFWSINFGLSDADAPFTVISQADKTITINGKQYREGDFYNRGETGDIPDGVVIAYRIGDPWVEFTHIPDELADKPEPKTLTLEDVSDRDAWFINPVNGSIDCIYPGAMSHYYALKAHLENGGKLYASRDDAERGKALGWS